MGCPRSRKQTECPRKPLSRTTHSANTHNYDSPFSLCSSEVEMTVRSICVSAMALMVFCVAVAQTSAPDLAFGQVYGSAGFVSSDPSGSMADAPNVVLAFTDAD